MNPVHPSEVDRYRRTADFERRTIGLRLRPVEWEVVLAVDGMKTLGEIASLCRISRDDAAAILARFETLGLVETPRLTLDEYRAGERNGEPEAIAAGPPARVMFSLRRTAPAPGNDA